MSNYRNRNQYDRMSRTSNKDNIDKDLTDVDDTQVEQNDETIPECAYGDVGCSETEPTPPKEDDDVSEEVSEDQTIKEDENPIVVNIVEEDDAKEEIQDKGTPSMSELSINSLLDGYVKLTTGIVSEKDAQLAIRKFTDIVKMVIANPSKEVLDTVYTFFKKNEKMKNPAVVLNGIQYVPNSMRDKVELFFTVFRLITMDSKETLKSFDKESIRTVFESEDFYHYVSNKYDNLK